MSQLKRLYCRIFFPGYSAKESLETLHTCIAIEGKHSYGMEHLSIYDFGEGHRLRIGSFNSIAPGQVVFLGGNHRVDWATTYPFGHLHLDRFPREWSTVRGILSAREMSSLRMMYGSAIDALC